MKKICTNNGLFNVTDALYEALQMNNVLMEDEDSTNINVIKFFNGLCMNNDEFYKIINSDEYAQRKDDIKDNISQFLYNEEKILKKQYGTNFDWHDLFNDKMMMDSLYKLYYSKYFPQVKLKSLNQDTNNQDTNNQDTNNQDTNNQDTNNQDTNNQDTNNQDTNNQDINNQDTNYIINYDFPNTKQVIINYFSKYNDEKNFQKFINTENSETIKDQNHFLKEIRRYIDNAMSSLGRSKYLLDYVITEGKTSYSLNYEREKKDDRTLFNDLSDRLIGQNITNEWENLLKEKIQKTLEKDIQIPNNPTKRIIEKDGDTINIDDIVANTFCKFLKGWFYKFIEEIADNIIVPFDSQYNNDKKDADYIFYCIDLISYNICKNLFYNNNELSVFGKYIIKSRNNKDLINKAERLFYLNIVCFKKDVYDDIKNYISARPSISSKNGKSELIFEMKRVQRVRNVMMQTIQIFLNHRVTKGKIMICNLDIMYALSKAKPFMNDLKSTLKNSLEIINNKSKTNKM